MKQNFVFEQKPVALGDVIVDVKPGFAVGERDTNGVIQVRMNNVDTTGQLDLEDTIRVPATARQICDCSLKEGDVLFNNTNSTELVGKSALFRGYHEPVTFSNHFTRLRVDPERLDPRYLARWLTKQQQSRLFERLCTRWVGQSAVRSEKLLGLQIPLPPLQEQHRIAAILDKADSIRMKRRTARQLAEQLVRASFIDLFGDPARNIKGWRTERLGELAQLDRGRSRHRPRDEPRLYGDKYPFIQTGDIAKANGRITSYKQMYSELGLEQSKLWPAGTLCITIAANIAHTAILTFPACFPDSVVGLVPGEALQIDYVQQWFVAIRELIDRQATQVAQKNINLEILNNLMIPVPPQSLQLTFTKIVKKARDFEDRLLSSSRAIEAFFESLSDRAFRGEL